MYTIKNVGGSRDGEEKVFNENAIKLLGQEMVGGSQEFENSLGQGEPRYEVYRYDDTVAEGNVIYCRLVKTYNREQWLEYNRQRGLTKTSRPDVGGENREVGEDGESGASG